MGRDVKRGPDDDRQDTPKRDRIDELVASTERWRVDMDERYRKVAILLVVMVVSVAVAVVAGYLVLQGDRWAATRDACERTNASTEAVVGLLRELNADERTILVAERRFPHVPPLGLKPSDPYTGPRSCSEQASNVVWGPRL